MTDWRDGRSLGMASHVGGARFVEDGVGYLSGKFFQAGQGAAGSETGIFQKR